MDNREKHPDGFFIHEKAPQGNLWGFGFLAERKGFEPLIQLPVYTLSRRAPSTARTSLQVLSAIAIVSSWWDEVKQNLQRF